MLARIATMRGRDRESHNARDGGSKRRIFSLFFLFFEAANTAVGQTVRTELEIGLTKTMIIIQNCSLDLEKIYKV
jgi:hypothetical protein